MAGSSAHVAAVKVRDKILAAASDLLDEPGPIWRSTLVACRFVAPAI